MKQCRSKTRDAIESFLRLSIQDLQFAQRSNAPLLVVGNRRSYPAALCSQHPRTYLRSGVAARERLDQPVGDASSGLSAGVFLRGNHDHWNLMIFYLPDRTTIRHSIDPALSCSSITREGRSLLISFRASSMAEKKLKRMPSARIASESAAVMLGSATPRSTERSASAGFTGAAAENCATERSEGLEQEG